MLKYIIILSAQILFIKSEPHFIIDSVKVTPVKIYENDTVSFIDFLTLPTLYTIGGDTITKTGNLTRIQGVYYNSGFAQVGMGSDTFKLGTFAPGVYEILYLASQCFYPFDSADCSGFDTAIVYFTVLGPSGLNNIEDDGKLTLFPNPAANQLLISATGFQAQAITIYNLNGQQLINLPFAREVDVSVLPPGVYFVAVMGKEAVEVKKLVKL